MTRRNTEFGEVELVADPPWLLAPIFLRDFLRLEMARPDSAPGRLIESLPAPTAGINELSADREAERAAQKAAAATDWPHWWSAALDVPGSLAQPHVEPLSCAPRSRRLWRAMHVESYFDDWLARRSPRRAPDPHIERDLLASLERRQARSPALRTLQILILPVAGAYFVRPAPDRLVVAAPLRRDQGRYASRLAPVLASYF